MERLRRRPHVITILSLTFLLFACERPSSSESEQDDASRQASPTQSDDAPTGEPIKLEPASAPSPAIGSTELVASYPDFADLVEASRPAVINIYTKSRKLARTRNPFYPHVPRERVSESLGSGFIIDPSGLALTNHHVIKDATDIEVRLLDERRFKAKIVGQDPRTDTALIQIETAEELPTLPMADSEKLRVGEWVLAIGNPLGLTSTVTAGITSATGRKHVPLGGDLLYQDFIQTDASINPGNSGGPLLNMRGEVVGINTAISAEAQGIGFAIPINMVKQLLPQLKLGKVSRSWLGIYIDEVPAALASQIAIEPGMGALVRRVVKGGPADLAKLEPGDVLLKVDGEPIKDADHLSWTAGHKGIGKTIDIELMRGNQRMMTRLKLGALPD